MRLIRSPLVPAAVLLLLLGTAAGLRAQPSTASPPVSDRAAREAQNPLRVILEAGRLKMRVKPEPETPVAPPRKDAPVRARPAAAPAPEVAKTAPPSPRSVTRAAPETAPMASAPASSAAPDTAVAATTSLPASASEPPLQTPAVLPAPPTAALAEPAPVPAGPLPPLKNIHLVEPELPVSTLRRLRGEVEVLVGFTVNTDGSVSDVAIRSSPNQALDGPVVEAVRQWRYAPVGQPRSHAVQLVLRGER